MSEFKPISFFLDLCISGGVKNIELGIYKYVPQSIDDFREVKRLAVKGFPRKFQDLKESLGADYDISVHSRIQKKIAGNVVEMHVPMLDLAGELPSDSLSSLQEVAGEFGITRFAIFHSGRSYHVYFYKFLTRSDWARFMGRCLLLNRLGSVDLVDTRWIGHRLYAGYSSLRWTQRNSWYVGNPYLSGGFDVTVSRPRAGSKARSKPGTVQPWLFPASSA